ncbi:MAG TPA: hypothetical protein PKA91_21050 [Leptospiraceae bacterium]|nr:hypothetical protein [Leptospiraceae bacterium]
MDLTAHVLHWVTRIVFPLCFLPFLFPYVPVLFFILAALAIFVYLGERKTRGLPLTQSRSFHVMRLVGVGSVLNAVLYFGFTFHSEVFILKPLSQQLDPVREYYRSQSQEIKP